MRSALALLAGLVLGTPRPARADLTNNKAIDDHADEVLARVNVSTLDPEQKQALLANRLLLSLGGLVPVFGSYKLDTKVYGEVRPAAVLFDWILGGLVPVGLGATALVNGTGLPRPTRAALGWSALAVYGATRVGVIVIGNFHITEYNDRLRVGLGLGTTGGLAPTAVVTARW